MSEKNKNIRPQKVAIALIACFSCVLINFGLSKVAAAIPLPIYFDTLGTMIASLFGGFVPGILVGYITNLVTCVNDPMSVYYGLTNVLIAVFAAFAGKRGWFQKPALIIASIFIFACLGGVVGSGISWCIYGMGEEAWELSEYAQYISQATGITGYSAQLLCDFLFDLADKAVMVAALIIINKLVPKRIKSLFEFNIWQQSPLTEEEMHTVDSTKTRRWSIQPKIVGVVALVMIAVVAVTVVISSAIFFRTHVETQSKMGDGITSLMVDRINGNRVDVFMAEGDAAPGYTETEEALKEVRNKFPDVEYVYAYKIEEDGCHVVFDLDTEETEANEPGDIIEFDPSFESYLPALLSGEEIEPIVSNDSFGWLLTIYKPVYDDNGNCACYVGIDVSMNHLVDDGIAFLIRLLILAAAFFIFVCIITLWLAQYCLILPVNSIAKATSNFAFDSAESRLENTKRLQDLGIKTGDELENLYLAISKTTEDTMEYIAKSHERAKTIERMQDNLIIIMADLVESRDKFTGDHVRKTAAYTKVIMAQLQKDGKYIDELTDEFIENVVKSAPLHDIGKIAVSDTILNKPGRLTPEEFEIMKNHTTAGYEILENAKGAMSDAGYLDEAQRLALSHHEKWSGEGYPNGLKGEEIPLSARIMAVADVFDALVSKRSYKEGMPLDKAFSIIKEDAGTHFDPVVAEAFLNAESEVRKIAEEHGDSTGTAQDIRDAGE